MGITQYAFGEGVSSIFSSYKAVIRILEMGSYVTHLLNAYSVQLMKLARGLIAIQENGLTAETHYTAII